MTRLRPILTIAVIFLLLLAAAGGAAWWYLYGPNDVEAADLVPANTVFFAAIPNATAIVTGYETSKLKTLIESPNAKPAQDSLGNLIGQKNLNLIQAFLPNLSGQSFIAVTHFDADHPEQVGVVAAMKPKPGTDNFDAFVQQLKSTWPDVIRQGSTGTGTIGDVQYQWIQGPGSPRKICVAHVRGWIVTTWGESALQDWLERLHHRSATTSLSHDQNYRDALARIGDNPMTVLYVNYRTIVDILRKQMAQANPAMGDYLAKKLDSIGGAALGTRFENGEIVDRFVLLMPRPAQLDSGMGADPCPFDTLKFTGPDTRLYWASSINWKQYYQNLQDQGRASDSGQPAMNPMIGVALNSLQTWVASAGLDLQHNLIDPLGSEFSLQVDWPSDAPFPEAGFLLKVDKPDDFKPTIAALIDLIKTNYGSLGTVKEEKANGQDLATLQFNQVAMTSPTITEDGPYLGIFMTQNQATRSFQRAPGDTLDHNPDFAQQIGSKRSGASQLLFLDSPRLLDHAYRTALPYLSLASMFNKNLAALTQGRNLPPDLTWLAPIGTWSYVMTPDDESVQGYSVSGIGNQGIILALGAGGAAGFLQANGIGLAPHAPTSAYVPGGNLPLNLPHHQNPFGGSASATFPPLPPQPALNTTPGAPDDNAPRSVIYIHADGSIYFESTPVPADQIGDFLKAKRAANEDMRLFVKVDRNSDPSVLAKVMDAGAQAGFGVLPYDFLSGPATNTTSAPVTPTPEAATNVELTAPLPPTNTETSAPAPDNSTNAEPAALTPPTNAPATAPSTNAETSTQPQPMADRNTANSSSQGVRAESVDRTTAQEQ